MYSNPVNTHQDALEIVRRYRLDNLDLGGGSAEGFAAWLFAPRQEVKDVKAVAEAIGTYKALFAERALATPNFDQATIEDAKNISEALQSRAEERAALGRVIRSVQWAPNGGAVWAAVAELATTSREERRAALLRLNQQVKDGVEQAFLELRKFEGYLGETVGQDYEAGAHPTLDYLLRMDIERFESTLAEAPPWNGDEDERSYEMRALHALIGGGLFGDGARTASSQRRSPALLSSCTSSPDEELCSDINTAIGGHSKERA